LVDCQKTRDNELRDGEDHIRLRSVVLSAQITIPACDGLTDRLTDRRADENCRTTKLQQSNRKPSISIRNP